MHADTRQRLLDIAEQLFAERGFYGVSIAAIASEVGLTKQGLLHYFNSKEKLYGAIVQRISDDFQDLRSSFRPTPYGLRLRIPSRSHRCL